MKNVLIFHICWCFFAGSAPAQDIHKPGVVADSGMVVTAHSVASAIGLSILKKGRNAFDAAIAVEFALSVCYPMAGNIAAGGFAPRRVIQKEVSILRSGFAPHFRPRYWVHNRSFWA